MFRYNLRTVLALVFVWNHLYATGLTKECEYLFEFPSLNKRSSLTVDENTTLLLPFRLKTHCSLPARFKIDISKRSSNSAAALWVAVCSIWHVDGECHPFVEADTNCSCLPAEKEYELRRVIQLTDDAVWSWQTSIESAIPTNVELNIIRNLPTTSPQTNISDGTEEFSPTGKDLIIIVLGGVGIIGLVATAITIIVVCARKGQANRESQPQLRYQANLDQSSFDDAEGGASSDEGAAGPYFAASQNHPTNDKVLEESEDSDDDAFPSYENTMPRRATAL